MVTDPDGSAIKRDPLVDYRATATAVIATPHAHARLRSLDAVLLTSRSRDGTAWRLCVFAY
eukprot:30294-Pelagococcus_subviridis.AAC.49